MNNIEEINNSSFNNSSFNNTHGRKILKGLKTIKINDQSELNEIGEKCFKGFPNLEKVEIITSKELTIGESAFQDCSGLKTITISLTNDYPSIIIKEGAFKNTTLLENIYITSTKNEDINISLGDSAFNNSGLQYIGKFF